MRKAPWYILCHTDIPLFGIQLFLFLQPHPRGILYSKTIFVLSESPIVLHGFPVPYEKTNEHEKNQRLNSPTLP